MTRRLILTADDFGMSVEVNEAVEEAHRDGILTCASLVVAGDAAEDAIRRAKRMPGLGVGLHLALYGAPAQQRSTPAPTIAPDGLNLGRNPVATGAAIMLRDSVRGEARREIGAQFEAWRKTGLQLGHLDGHWHCHQHPAILAIALEMAKPLGLRAVRIPYESFSLSYRISDGHRSAARLADAIGHYPLAVAMRRRVRAAGLRANDWFFGKADGGSIDAQLLSRAVAHLPDGTTEIGLHPSVRPWRGAHAPPSNWNTDEEFQALTDPAVAALLQASGVELSRWADLP